MQQLQAAGRGLGQAGEYGGDFLQQRLGNLLEIAALGSAAHSGNLGGEMQRLFKQRAEYGTLSPEVQNTLGPLFAGANFLGGSRQDVPQFGGSAPELNRAGISPQQAQQLGVQILGPDQTPLPPQRQFKPNVPDIYGQQQRAGVPNIPGFMFQRRTGPTGNVLEESVTTGSRATGNLTGKIYTTEAEAAAAAKKQQLGYVPLPSEYGGGFVLRNPAPALTYPGGSATPGVNPARPQVITPPKVVPLDTGTDIDSTPTPGGPVLTTSRKRPADITQTLAQGEAVKAAIEALRQPVRNSRGDIGPAPIDTLRGGTAWSIGLSLPGGGALQEFLVGKQARGGGKDDVRSLAAQALLSASGSESQLARYLGQRGVLTDQDILRVVKAYLPDPRHDTNTSADHKITLLLQKIDETENALKQTGDINLVRALWGRGVQQLRPDLSFDSEGQAPPTGTTIPQQQQDTAPGYNGAPSSQSAPAATGTNRAVKLKNGTTFNVIVH